MTLNPLGDQGYAPVNAYCKLPEGITQIGQETKFEVEHCQTQGCFHYNTTEHDYPIEQIKTIINDSLSCWQSIKVDCVSAPIMDRVCKKFNIRHHKKCLLFPLDSTSRVLLIFSDL